MATNLVTPVKECLSRERSGRNVEKSPPFLTEPLALDASSLQRVHIWFLIHALTSNYRTQRPMFCQGHSTLSSQRVEGAQLTQLVQLVTAGRLFLGHEGRVDP